MRWGWTTLVGLVALLGAFGLAACGGDSSSNAGGSSAQAESKPDDEATTGTASGGHKGGSEAQGKSEPGSGEGAGSFKPKPHQDSGGGSAQYRVKGGDNSIQDFGSEAEGSEFEKAAAALHGFLDARAAGDWGAACGYLSKSTVESLESLAARASQGEGTSCAKILGKVTNPAARSSMKAEAAKADVRSLRTEGERSFLIFTGAEKTVLAIPMAHEGGAWKVASLAATPIS